MNDQQNKKVLDDLPIQQNINLIVQPKTPQIAEQKKKDKQFFDFNNQIDSKMIIKTEGNLNTDQKLIQRQELHGQRKNQTPNKSRNKKIYLLDVAQINDLDLLQQNKQSSNKNEEQQKIHTQKAFSQQIKLEQSIIKEKIINGYNQNQSQNQKSRQNFRSFTQQKEKQENSVQNNNSLEKNLITQITPKNNQATLNKVNNFNISHTSTPSNNNLDKSSIYQENQLKQNNSVQPFLINTIKQIDENTLNFIFQGKKHLNNLQQLLDIHNILENIQVTALNSSKPEFLSHCQQYLEIITQGQLDNLEFFLSNPIHQKIVKLIVVMERIGVNLIIFISLEAIQKASTQENIRSVSDIILKNNLIILQILATATKISEIDTKISRNLIQKALNNQTIENENNYQKLEKQLQELRQNYEISTKIFKPILNQFNDLSIQISKIFKNIDKTSNQDALSMILDAFKQKIQHQSQFLQQQTLINGTNQQVTIPFLPEQSLQKDCPKYTLILDLDETLVHYVETQKGGHFLTRPYLEKFLRELSPFYEIVVFTAGMKDYANWVCDKFDTNSYIRHRLYRQHTYFYENSFIKDLDKLGRDISKVIIIDNMPSNFQLHQANGIAIKSWINDPKDTALLELIPVMKDVIQNSPEDIRPVLKSLRDKYPPKKTRYQFNLPQNSKLFKND